MKTAYYFRFFILMKALLVLCFLLSVNVFGQAGESQESRQVNSLQKGIWAIQFQINDNFSLSSFQGSSISAKYHFSNKRAIRFGLTLSGGFSDQKDGSIESNTNSQNIGLSTQYTIYPAVNKEVNLFFGLGPNVLFVRRNAESKYQNTQTNKQGDTHWSVGVAGIVGVEWFVKRSISFLAEYSSSLNYNSDKRKDANDNERHTKSFDLNSKSVKFGLSLYF